MHFNPTKLSDNEIIDLAERLKADKNNKEIKDKLILAFMIPAAAIASRYHKATGLEYNDLQGEAILGVVEAVNRFYKIKHRNIGGYVNKYIHQYCHRFVKQFSKRNCSLIDYPSKDSFFDNIILFDILSIITKTEREKEIIELRLEGLSDVQIGKVFGMSRQYVWSIRETLFNRYRRKS